MGKREGLDLVAGIVYINLEHRTDRRERLCQELKRLHLSYPEMIRIPAFHTPLNGRKGCILSHIAGLEMAEEKGWEHVLILEDDCQFSASPQKIREGMKGFQDILQGEWDVFFLGGQFLESRPVSSQLLHITKSHRAHAYIVNRPYYSVLKACYLSAYKNLEKDIFVVQSSGKALDVAWNDLQKKGRWYGMRESIAEQRESFSDIVHRPVYRKEENFNASEPF
ncbi:MAG: hypothetical protein AB7N99_05625 [Simkaniaceae bacterium]|jgi:hypothetical protein